MRLLSRVVACLTLAVAASVALHAAHPAPLYNAAEARATRAYDVAVKGGPLTLRGYIGGFPKGADLHVHLSGAVYAETFIKEAGEDGLCVDSSNLTKAA